MRDENFEAVLHALERKVNNQVAKITNPTRKDLAVCGLARKCLSHCEMALSLVEANALAEATIILRAAYEAVIRGIYLQEHPDKLPAYEAFSAIAMLRNQLEMVKILGELGDPYEDKKLQKQLIEEQKQRIISHGFHTHYKLSEVDLDKWEAVKKVTNKSNLPSFEEIRKSIQQTPLVTALLTTGFQVYNIGSQMAHSSFEMMSTMVYFDMKHPLYTEHVVYRQVWLLMLCASQCYASCGAIGTADFDLLENEYEKSIKKLVFAGSMQQ
jgi:hypothetical protein